MRARNSMARAASKADEYLMGAGYSCFEGLSKRKIAKALREGLPTIGTRKERMTPTSHESFQSLVEKKIEVELL